MTLDLDDIERKARAALQSTWSPDDPADPQDVIDDERGKLVVRCYRAPIAANTSHIAAASPPVVLALIDRQRALENMVQRAAALLEANSDQGARKAWAAALRDELAAGTVVS